MVLGVPKWVSRWTLFGAGVGVGVLVMVLYQARPRTKRLRTQGSPPPVAAVHSSDASNEEHDSLPTLMSHNSKLLKVPNPEPILADWPQYVEPIRNVKRYHTNTLIQDAKGNLEVRCWRFSYNARGVIESRQWLEAEDCAVVVVHPWGVDDGQGCQTPEPAGVCFFGGPARNRLVGRHIREVLGPFVRRLRPHVVTVVYSLPGREDRIRKKLYRSIHGRPSEEQRREGEKELAERLTGFVHRGEELPEFVSVDEDRPIADYFRQFPGLEWGPTFNRVGYWDLPIPVHSGMQMSPEDVVIYDQQGYPALKNYLIQQGVRHVLLAGYATDLCLKSTTAGYDNLSKDFNVFIVGDATLASFPAFEDPRYTTSAALARISIQHYITQISWIRYDPRR